MLLFGPSRKKLLAQPKLLGRWGEKCSEKFLCRKGLATVARNFSCKLGEIDLVMTEPEGVLVFVEVKTRADEKFSAAEDSITPAKRKSLARAAQYFVKSNNIGDVPLRFDVIVVVLADNGKPEIRHYENAFRP